MAEVVILIPVLRRPHRAAPVVESIDQASPHARILFICSPGDTAEHAAVERTGAGMIVIDQPPGTGDYARKVQAGFEATVEPLVFLGADDLCFHPGWYEAAKAGVDAGAHAVGTNDLGNPRVMRGEHATHCLVTRDYVERFGTIDQRGQVLHEGYEHEYVDDEFVGTAKHRGVWAFAEDSHVEHLHPHWGKAPYDPLYDRQRTRMRASKALYLARRRLWT